MACALSLSDCVSAVARGDRAAGFQRLSLGPPRADEADVVAPKRAGSLRVVLREDRGCVLVAEVPGDSPCADGALRPGDTVNAGAEKRSRPRDPFFRSFDAPAPKEFGAINYVTDLDWEERDPKGNPTGSPRSERAESKS